TASTAYSDIQRATSEIKILEELTQSLSKTLSIEKFAQAVADLIKQRFPGCHAELKPGEHDGVPVVFEDKTIATICVTRPESILSDDEIGLIRAIAEQIAGPYSKAMALETARIEATVDKLTGLANRRAFEMISAAPGPDPFSIVLVDVNAFKAVNDNFGHKAGDDALIRIAAHMRAAFHDS